MLTVRIGKSNMMRRKNLGKKFVQISVVLVSLLVLVLLTLQQYGPSLRGGLSHSLLVRSELSALTSSLDTKQPDAPCGTKRQCPDDQFSFYLQSGAANVVAAKICIKNELVLGSVLNNAGVGINVVVVNGRTGDVVKTGHYDMYGGDVAPLIELLKSVESGSVVLMASFDEPSSKLTEDARKLIAELGSSSINSLGFRDNWVFVGGKGADVKSSYEKYLKNDSEKNKYENWPELIELEGCIPRYME
ncbi:protein FAM3C-like [Mugil cephalus]|uniref:protein FAM3C-like n=1 Tax=Mugil cephalus TaxID=48193 RepID=UPI001FB72CDC|nr:protein FAM3C-like [Mugil cephalus]